MSEWLIGLSEYIGDMSDELDSVKAENAKLRELVRDMLRNMHGCTFHHDCGFCGFDECIYEARARDLGVDA